MKKVELRLAEFRAKRAEQEQQSPPAPSELSSSAVDESQTEQKTIWLSFLSIFLNADLLDFYPLRVWRRFYARSPGLCLFLSAVSWILCQSFFAYVEFGFVFFVFSAFVVIFLNLGTRRPGEVSAYSVFNPECERLPGTMTAEHFERDLLRRNRPT